MYQNDAFIPDDRNIHGITKCVEIAKTERCTPYEKYFFLSSMGIICIF